MPVPRPFTATQMPAVVETFGINVIATVDVDGQSTLYLRYVPPSMAGLALRLLADDCDPLHGGGIEAARSALWLILADLRAIKAGAVIAPALADVMSRLRATIEAL